MDSSYFIDEEMEDQGGFITCPKLHRLEVFLARFKLSPSESEAGLLYIIEFFFIYILG